MTRSQQTLRNAFLTSCVFVFIAVGSLKAFSLFYQVKESGFIEGSVNDVMLAGGISNSSTPQFLMLYRPTMLTKSSANSNSQTHPVGTKSPNGLGL